MCNFNKRPLQSGVLSPLIPLPPPSSPRFAERKEGEKVRFVGGGFAAAHKPHNLPSPRRAAAVGGQGLIAVRLYETQPIV